MMAIGATEAQIAIKVLALAVKQGWLDKLLNAFRKKHTILVLGSTGTGKTNFLQSLTELTPQAIDQMNRTEFARKHSISIAFPIPFTLMVVIFLFEFENLRKKGDMLFEEISDELHWYLGYRKQKDSGTATNDGQPPAARVILRAFAQAADLPLIPGKFGPAIYAGVNVVIALLFLYFRLKS